MSDAARRNRFPAALGSSSTRSTPATSPTAPLRPQRAVVPAAASTPSSGLGLDSAGVRDRMVQRLRAGGLRHEPVLQALGRVPRHLFVDTALANQAYEDTSLPIGFGQTISKPSVVGRMIELLFSGANAASTGSLGRVLEIGTGCGYQAAVLMHLSRQVMSIERVKPLHDRARQHLASLREHHVRLIYGDGRIGHGPNAPYDSVIAAAGGEDIPAAWLDQLAPGGRLVAPRVDSRNGGQVLVAVDRRADGSYTQSLHEAVLFVPLKSGLA